MLAYMLSLFHVMSNDFFFNKRYKYDEASTNDYDEYRSLLHDGVGDSDELNQEHKSFTYHGKIAMSPNVPKSWVKLYYLDSK